VFEPLDAITRASYRTFASLPGGTLIDDGEIFAVMNEVPLPFFNGVATTRMRDGARIAEVHEWYRARRRGFRWWVTPDSTPAGLDSLLEAHGFRHAYDSLGMTADLAKLKAVKPSELQIKRVRDLEEMTVWADILTSVFKLTDADRQAWLDAFEALGFGDESKWAHFTGYLFNQPVGIATVMTDGDIAGIYDVATVPAARGRGAGSTLTLHALQLARDLGARHAALQSSEMGESVYRSIGFVPGPTLRLYDWRPQ
jgi:GNAT superfamily N-acetyltransferase